MRFGRRMSFKSRSSGSRSTSSNTKMAEAYANLRAVMGAYNEVMTANVTIETVSQELKNLPCWECQRPRAADVRGLLNQNSGQPAGRRG
jgi:hypothetical protein